jgi:LysR family cys regulon transcriptional activator
VKLRQLQYVAEIAKEMNVSEAARKLHTSQPGVSRYVALLEKELGLHLFVREKKRIVRLTLPGEAVVKAARRALAAVENVEQIAKHFRAGNLAEFTVATAHTHARYTLPRVVEQFTLRYPDVRLTLRQGYLSEALKWVLEGDADIFVATLPSDLHPDLVALPCHPIHRIVLTPSAHPLVRRRRISLRDLCRVPIITYEQGFSARSTIMSAFREGGLKPNIVLSATDADVMKTYVRTGLGVAILADIVYDAKVDADLRAISARHLFKSSTVVAGFRRGGHLPEHVLYFFELLEVGLTRSQIIGASE